MTDFFVSYNRHDRAWAEWIAWTLEAAGYSTVIQAWDFRAGGNFVLDMQKATSEAERTIAVLSETYLKSEFTAPEWAAAFAQDPTGKDRTLIPVRVKECQPQGLLKPIVYIDLVGLDEEDAQDLLLRSLVQDRAKPDQKPRFPGNVASSSDRPRPMFPPSIPCNLPLVSAIFVGRDDELERLYVQLQAKATIAISAVSGMGGIGKTELAAQYALQQRDMGTYSGGICWLKAREDLSTQIVLFARSQLALSIPEDLELAEQVGWCWRNWQPGETLIVFDDVQQYEDIVPVLPPQRSQFRVLLTTRLKLQSPVQNFEITVLSEEKAIELLRAIVTDGRIDQDLATTKEICQWLGYLPLGLELVGRYLVWDRDITLSVLWQRLQEKRIDAIALKQTYPGMTASDGVAAAFELSWQTLDEPAQQLAALLSLFAPAEIPWTLVEACLPEWDTEDLQVLRNQSLLNLHLLERTGQDMYQLHQLLHEFFAAKREQMPVDEGMKRSFCQVMVAMAKQISHPPTLLIIEQIKPAIPHLKEIATTFIPCLTDADLIVPSTRLGQFYQGQAAYSEAEEWYKQCHTIVLQRFGTDHPLVAISLNNLAGLYQVQGRYAEAESLFTHALNILEHHLGTDYPGVATSLNNLALLYLSQGRYVEAKLLVIRALETAECQLGADHPDVAASLKSLAGLYREQGHYAEAELLVTRALNILERQFGADHPDVATSLNNLADLYRVQGHDAEAETLFIRALNILERQFGVDHLYVATSLNNLALLYLSQRRYAEAESIFTRALDITKRQLGADHSHVATSLNNLAELYKAQGRYAEAEPLYVRARDIQESQLGADHPNVAASLNNLAGLYYLQERYAEAERCYLQALSILIAKLATDHPNTQTGWRNFLRFLQEVIQAGQTGQLSDHPATQDLLRQMGEGSGE